MSIIITLSVPFSRLKSSCNYNRQKNSALHLGSQKKVGSCVSWLEWGSGCSPTVSTVNVDPTDRKPALGRVFVVQSTVWRHQSLAARTTGHPEGNLTISGITIRKWLTMPQVMWSVTSLSPHMPEFNSRPVHVGNTVDTVLVGPVFIQIIWSFPCQ